MYSDTLEPKHIDSTMGESTLTFHEGPLFGQDEFGWLINITSGTPNAALWHEEHRALVEARLKERGVVLIRGTAFSNIEAFEAFISSVGEKLSYEFRSTPRSELKGKVYTSTNFPASETILLHNENAYSASYPNKVIFGCLVAPQTGGATTLADSHAIYNLLPQQIKERFERFGIKYVRNMGTGFDLHWQEVFQTKDKAVVEQACQKMGLTYSWHGDVLRTEQILSATKVHPDTQLTSWFNQAHLFHYSSMDADIADWLLGAFGEESLPRNSYYGDGSRLEPEVLEQIHAVYSQCLRSFPWQIGDLLIVDNVRAAHGRAPFTGDRTILTGMTT